MKPKHLVAVALLVITLAGCSVAQTATVYRKPESEVTLGDRVSAWQLWQAARRLPSPGPSGCDYEGLIRQTFVEDPDWAVSIAMRESRCQPGAANPSGSMGLFQLLLPLHNDLLFAVGCAPDQWSDPVCNTEAAHLLYQGAGRRPWSL